MSKLRFQVFSAGSEGITRERGPSGGLAGWSARLAGEEDSCPSAQGRKREEAERDTGAFTSPPASICQRVAGQASSEAELAAGEEEESKVVSGSSVGPGSCQGPAGEEGVWREASGTQEEEKTSRDCCHTIAG